ncbi:MAG: glycosyltransferase family 4 protein [Pseudomonadota bacterium]
MQVLHISADFPDPLRPAKTRAVANLLELAPEHNHFVYSLNRTGWRAGVAALPFDDAHRAVAYGAPPFAVALRRFLLPVAHWIIRDAEQRNLKPAVVHAHKLVVEGLIGEIVADALGARLVVSSQGNTDLKFISARRSLRPAWQKVWRAAEVVLPFAPWTGDALASMLGPRDGPVLALPCPTAADRQMPPRRCSPVVRSIFCLDEAENKNAAHLIAAVEAAAALVPEIRLEIIGTGSPSSFARMTKMIGANRRVRLLGPVPNGQIQQLLNRSACMALPSRRESYGMAFAEALLAGCPVVHGAGSGIDGYFPERSFAASADPDSVESLAAVLTQMVKEQFSIKQDLLQAQRRGEIEVLQRPSIARTYRQALTAAAGMVPELPGLPPRPGLPLPA